MREAEHVTDVSGRTRVADVTPFYLAPMPIDDVLNVIDVSKSMSPEEGCGLLPVFLTPGTHSLHTFGYRSRIQFARLMKRVSVTLSTEI